jgi:hypothetical protein
MPAEDFYGTRSKKSSTNTIDNDHRSSLDNDTDFDSIWDDL